MQLLCVFLLLGALSVFSQPAYPSLPTAYEVNIEANLIGRNVTWNLREYQDSSVGFSRYEIVNGQGYTIIIEDHNQNIAYNITNNTVCTTSTLTPNTTFLPSFIETATDIFRLGNMTYQGTASVRGVPCNVWQTQLTRRNGSLVLSIQTYFAVDWWGYSNSNWGQKPMRALINGTGVNSQGTPMTFTSYQEFVNFVPQQPLPSTWVPPSICFNLGTQVLSTIQTKAGASLAAGMFFFGLFFGILVTGLSIWFYCKKRQARFDQFKSSQQS